MGALVVLLCCIAGVQAGVSSGWKKIPRKYDNPTSRGRWEWYYCTGSWSPFKYTCDCLDKYKGANKELDFYIGTMYKKTNRIKQGILRSAYAKKIIKKIKNSMWNNTAHKMAKKSYHNLTAAGSWSWTKFSNIRAGPGKKGRKNPLLGRPFPDCPVPRGWRPE